MTPIDRMLLLQDADTALKELTGCLEDILKDPVLSGLSFDNPEYISTYIDGITAYIAKIITDAECRMKVHRKRYNQSISHIRR